jgi:predicted phage terminase large subunit-like protein
LSAIRAEIARREAERQRADVARNAEAIRARCQTLVGFVREAWHVLEPTARYVHNWHIDAICMHLEAVTAGQITRLLINIPPGEMKSLLVSVLWPAWEWGPKGLRSLRYLATAFNDGPVKRDTRKCRDLILSDWYRSLWPDVELTRTGETSFANSSTGVREGVAFGSLTSQRGDRVLIDDPHSTDTVESDAERDSATRRFRERAIFSVNDPIRSAIVVIMQRLHQNDISGVILKYGMDFVHVCLPMEFEPETRNQTRWFSDPRQADGELLDPERFPPAEVEKLKRSSTSYAYAGQFQQRPSAREGAKFKRAWFADKIIQPGTVPTYTTWVRHWDLAATKKKTSARTAGVKMGKTSDGRFIIGDCIADQITGQEVRKLIKATAQTLDGRSVHISLPQDPGQAGKVQAEDYIALLAGFIVQAEPETGDKEMRAEPFASQCEGGNVYLVEGEWTTAYLDELCLFPTGSFKDRVDASSGAFGYLTMMEDDPAELWRRAFPN